MWSLKYKEEGGLERSGLFQDRTPKERKKDKPEGQRQDLHSSGFGGQGLHSRECYRKMDLGVVGL